jgi:hypothetical protein
MLCKYGVWIDLFVLIYIYTGAVPEGFALEQIHILLRPGITSSENVHNCVKVPASSHLFANHTYNLLKDSALHKNFQNVPAINSSIHCRKEQLHPLAHLQFQELGKAYNMLYMKKWNIETSHIAPKHFRIHSIDKTKSLSSLLSFLYGMLPLKHFEKINIQKLDTVTLSRTRSINLKLSECNFLPNLTNYLNNHFIKLSQKEAGINCFTSKILPNICTSFQHSTSSTTENLVKNTLLLMDKGVKSCSSHQKCQELADLHTFPWLQEFMRNLRMINNNYQKVFVYAVDQAFISYLMSSLRHRNVKVTHPGSHVAIEIYKNLYETVNPYYVKLLYNGIDISHHVPLCTKMYPWSLCKLKYFVDFQRQKYKSLFKASPIVQRKCHFSFL